MIVEPFQLRSSDVFVLYNRLVSEVLRAHDSPDRQKESTLALTLLVKGVGASNNPKWHAQNLAEHLEITKLSLRSDAARIEAQLMIGGSHDSLQGAWGGGSSTCGPF